MAEIQRAAEARERLALAALAVIEARATALGRWFEDAVDEADDAAQAAGRRAMIRRERTMFDALVVVTCAACAERARSDCRLCGGSGSFTAEEAIEIRGVPNAGDPGVPRTLGDPGEPGEPPFVEDLEVRRAGGPWVSPEDLGMTEAEIARAEDLLLADE